MRRWRRLEKKTAERIGKLKEWRDDLIADGRDIEKEARAFEEIMGRGFQSS
jgi:hypothetical protein